MAALLDDPAVVHDHDPVSLAHRGQPVRDHQGGAVLPLPIPKALKEPLQ